MSDRLQNRKTGYQWQQWRGGVGRVGRVKNDSDVKDKESLLRKEMIQQRVRMKEVSKISR